MFLRRGLDGVFCPTARGRQAACGESARARPAAPSSLRAQRSNPESFRGGGLDCFASLAMTSWRQCAPAHCPGCPPPLRSDNPA
ncbi:hypothetical protein C7G41_14900 [Bradyrhizobium sp. MOS002]|nr:hypothetical protein C7G41_14900 [Bradyrhizobium sp. MOS002]